VPATGDDRSSTTRRDTADAATSPRRREPAASRPTAGAPPRSRRSSDRRAAPPAAAERARPPDGRSAPPRRRRPPVAAGPKPRASLLATLGLICGVAAALLVLSGPLLAYGIGLAVLALILSLSGIHATGSRHVAGKTDALIGMVLSLGAIVVGVLALTGRCPGWAPTCSRSPRCASG
jgi:hypothetical protein